VVFVMAWVVVLLMMIVMVVVEWMGPL